MGHCLVSFRGLEAPDWVLAALRDGRVPGVCLFAFNFASLGQFQALTRSLHEAAAEGGQLPPIVAIDQEGGQLMAVEGGATELPGNMALGASRSPKLAREAGRILGAELADLGVNMNLAPVLDLASRPENPVVGLRSFGDDPGSVARLGVAMIQGMQGAGVLACAKHFPGHGNTAIDSHHAVASVDRTLEELRSLELIPFEAAFAAGVGAVMAAHVHYPRLEDLPATFSPKVLQDVLRGHLGFTGLTVTDALDMQALAQVPGPDRARTALEAGADLAILGHLPHQEEIVADLADLWSPESLERVTAVRAALPTYAPRAMRPAVDWAGHAVLAKEMAAAAITVVRGVDRLPLELDPGDRMCVVTVSAGNLTPAETVGHGTVDLAAEVGRRHANVVSVRFAFGSRAGAREAAIRDVLEAASGARSVLLATVDAVADEGQQELFATLLARRHDPIVMALRNPLDVTTLAGSRVALCTYGRREDQVAAAVAVLFGEVRPSGRLPVRMGTPVDVADVQRG